MQNEHKKTRRKRIDPDDEMGKEKLDHHGDVPQDVDVQSCQTLRDEASGSAHATDRHADQSCADDTDQRDPQR